LKGATVSLPVVEAPVKFHLSLNVADLARSVAFYRVLFGLEPAKCHADYAKFELDEPPLVFSLVPHPPGPGASLSHLGLRLDDDEALARTRERLEAAGLCTQAQDNTVCGYARQNKVWAKDPDGNFWEAYVVEEEVDPRTLRTGLEGPAARLEPAAGPVVWEHYVTNPAPERVPHADGSVDEVRLVGTFNADLDGPTTRRLLGEAVRVLRPGGKLIAHGLMADRPFPGGQPKLPGLAALVSRVPAHAEVIEALREAGLVNVQAVKFPEAAWFRHGGAELREVKLLAWKPEAAPADELRPVLYKGPFRAAQADGGWLLPRGQRVRVPLAVWRQLRQGAAAEQFLFLEAGEGPACSGL
jgi:catechol 2,3-dioxygenase-like lactoylglutathione lyase family enzyme